LTRWDKSFTKKRFFKYLDQTFGTNGTVKLPVGTDSTGYAIALQPDGKILVGAHATYVDKKVSGSEYAIGRLNPNGTLDTSFGNNQGWWLAHPTNNGEEISKLAVVPNGTTFSIYGGGDTAAGFAVVKLDANGHPDPTYGTNGISVQHVGTSPTTYTTVGFTVASTGEAFVVGGYLVAFNPTGQLDTNFNGTGYTLPAAPGSFNAIVLQGQNILVAGHLVNVSQGMLARYTMTGTLDPTFGTGGTYLTPLTLASRVYFKGIAVEADGSIALVGYTGYTDAGQNHSALLVGHLSADGVADTTFGTDGTGFAIHPEFNEKYNQWLSISLDASGAFVIGGQTLSNGSPQGFVMRFTHP
jgi:uncharacterized delta-60 repeat protein